MSAQLDLAIFRRTVSSLWFMRHFANIPVRLSAFAFCAQVRPSQPLRLAAEVQLRFGQEISSLIEADDHVTLVTSYVHLYRTRSIDLSVVRTRVEIGRLWESAPFLQPE